MRRDLAALLSFLLTSCAFACTGEDPVLWSVSSADGGIGADGGIDDGGSRNERDGQAGDGGQLEPRLVLAAEPLDLVAGTTDVLRIKVVERQNIGELSFRVNGLPEGVTAPSVVTLPPTSNAITIDLTAAPSARHGDFDVTVEADGEPFRTAAKVVVRGKAGATDTGFGPDGTARIEITPGADLRAIGLADDRILLGFTSGGKPSLHVVSAKGVHVPPTVPVSQLGTLQGILPTDDGGFAILVTHTDGAHIVWFSSSAVEGKNVLASDKNAPLPRMAMTPLGILFAQATTPPSVTVKRILPDGVDATFPAAVLTGGAPSLYGLAGTPGGAAWVTMQTDLSQTQLARVEAGKPTLTLPLTTTESCLHPAALGEDLVARCTRDSAEPYFSIRRYRPSGGVPSLTLDTTFGTAGYFPVPSGGFGTIQSFGANRIYYSENGSTSLALRVKALDGAGAVRTVFGPSANGVMEVLGADTRPVFALDRRGRLLFVSNEQIGPTPGVRVRRFWD